MKKYFAVRGGNAVYLSGAEQIAEFLEKGCAVYEADGEGKAAIAEPGRPFERTVQIGGRKTMRIGGAADGGATG